MGESLVYYFILWEVGLFIFHFVNISGKQMGWFGGIKNHRKLMPSIKNLHTCAYKVTLAECCPQAIPKYHSPGLRVFYPLPSGP